MIFSSFWSKEGGRGVFNSLSEAYALTHILSHTNTAAAEQFHAQHWLSIMIMSCNSGKVEVHCSTQLSKHVQHVYTFKYTPGAINMAYILQCWQGKDTFNSIQCGPKVWEHTGIIWDFYFLTGNKQKVLGFWKIKTNKVKVQYLEY